MLLSRLGFLSCLVLICMLPIFTTLLISCDMTYVKSKKAKKVITLTLVFVSSGANFMLYFILHRIMLNRWNFIQTAKDIAYLCFSYQDIDLFPNALIIATVFSIALGFILKSILPLLHITDTKSNNWTVRQKAGIFLILSVIGLITICCYYYGFTGQRNIVINEVCSNNQNIVLDDKGTIYDYIELYNTGKLSCSLDGLYLSDDENNLKQFEIPVSLLPSNEYAVISLYSAPFSLKKGGGETVFLSDKSGNILDQITIEATDEDFAYSRQIDGGTDWNILSCTPGTTNTEAFLWETIPSSPVLSAESGFYAEEFDLTVSAEPGTAIYYTLDGSIPTADSLPYSEPIHVYDKSAEENVFRSIPNVILEWEESYVEPVDKAFIIRAVAINESGMSSSPTTATYFINQEEYHANAVISLIVEPEDLWGEDGIYVTGSSYDDWYLGEQEGDEPEPNFNKRGRDYEVPAYWEYFSNDLSVSQNVGLRIFGSTSRKSELKRFSLYARKEYSGSNFFNKRFFDVPNHKLVLRNGYGNAICQTLVQNRNVAAQRSICVSVFLNGEFWYDTNLMESYDARYFEERYGIRTDNIVIVKNGGIAEGLEEDGLLFDNIEEFVNTHDMADDTSYEEFCEIIDLQSYIDYICINTYIDNLDFRETTHNTIMWRSRNVSSSEYEDGRWRWAMYDLDWANVSEASRYGLDTKEEKNTFVLGRGSIPPINQWVIFKSLKANQKFCKQFVLTFMDLVNTNFVYENVQEEINTYGLSTIVPLWFDDFFANRADYIVPYMAEEFNLTGTLETVTLSVNDVSAGYIQLNTIEPDLSEGTWTGNYYTDYPVTATAIANDGYVFIGWEGITDSSEACIEVPVVEGGTNLYAVFRKVE